MMHLITTKTGFVMLAMWMVQVHQMFGSTTETTTTTAATTSETTTSSTETTTSASTTSSSSQTSGDNSIPELGATSVLLDDGGCLAICNNEVESCANDPHHHGSYCKFWQTIPVCFGMYVNGTDQSNTTSTNATAVSNFTSNLCFQPNDPSCDDSVLSPLICPSQTNTTCASICAQTESCVTDPNSQGSFCKTDNNVCFGLFWTDSSQTIACFEPNDPSCPSTFPVSCTPSGGVTTTTSGPTTESTATTETTSSETTETTTSSSETTTTTQATETTATTETTTTIPT